MSNLSMLESFLTGRSHDPPPPRVLRLSHTDAYAYTRLAPQHPLRAALHGAYLTANARHSLVKHEVMPLLRAWHAHGIQVLVYKGFALAEFMYATPGERFYGDVDLLIHERDAATARSVAAALGWSFPYADDWHHPNDHHLMHLDSPSKHAHVEVHRWAVNTTALRATAQRRTARLLWEASRPADLDGVPVRVPCPEDAILFPLVFQRAWIEKATSRWHFKPHDYLDFERIVERGGVTRASLERRASQLGVRRTLNVVLERLDPWKRTFRLSCTNEERAELDRRIRAERGDPRLNAALMQLSHKVNKLVPTVLDVARVAPDVARALWLLRRPDVRAILAGLDEVRWPSAPSGHVSVVRVQRGVKWGLWWLGRRSNACLPTSLALYMALRRRGLRPVFVSGVRREGAKMLGHAWIELDGRDLDKVDNRAIFKVMLQHPPRSE